jgi:hypothetical protein
MHFVQHPDTLHNPMGAKGVGEIGTVGMAAAVANAVHAPPASRSGTSRSRSRTCWTTPRPRPLPSTEVGQLGHAGTVSRSSPSSAYALAWRTKSSW